ncbi:MAG: hypothetical protein LUC38_05975 [Oscillospiraceae bacterium]|nr:hypothetical protein [Oscillospiraceae bacterium]
MKKTIKAVLLCALVIASVTLLSLAVFAEGYSLYSLGDYKGIQFSFRGDNKASSDDFGIAKDKTVELNGNVWFEIDPQTSSHYITCVVQLCHKSGLFEQVDLAVNLYPGSLGNNTNYSLTSLTYSNTASVDISTTRDYYITVETKGTDEAYYCTYLVNVNF